MNILALRFLLFPFALLYGLAVRCRNWLYDSGVFRSVSFKHPVIVVGNLSTGGTGKTPFVEYLVSLLGNEHRLAVLSRGYRRRTRGFYVASHNTNARLVGDEPQQLASKFSDVTVAVDHNRVRGIRKLLSLNPPPDCILLDDGFQHRSLTPGLSILLTEYTSLYNQGFLLPVGKLREHAKNSKRADIIVVTKSPAVHSPISEKLIRNSLKPGEKQLLYFSYITYGNLVPLHPDATPQFSKNHINTVVLFTGIANPSPLKAYLSDMCSEVAEIRFPDHYRYRTNDIHKILKAYDDLFTKNKIIVTTEKDAARIRKEKTFDLLKGYPVYYIPIAFAFHPHIKGHDFDKVIKDYVRNDKKVYKLDSKENNSDT